MKNIIMKTEKRVICQNNILSRPTCINCDIHHAFHKDIKEIPAWDEMPITILHLYLSINKDMEVCERNEAATYMSALIFIFRLLYIYSVNTGCI